MIRQKIFFLLPGIFISILLFGFFAIKAPITCAYDQGSCDNGQVCYTGGKGPDMAAGYACGDKQGYVYAPVTVNGTGDNNVQNCSSGNGIVANGDCCKPGTAKTPLPDHSGYDLGGSCSPESICYTGNYDNPKTGQQCGGLTGWHYGSTGGNQPSVPSCAAIGIGNAVCCDAGKGTLPSNLNPCPSDSTDGDCKSITTGLGKIDVQSPTDFIAKAFGILLSFAGGIALIIIIFSGYRILISRGDPEKLKNAREALTSAIVGLLFIIFSIVILQVIAIDVFHIPGFSK